MARIFKAKIVKVIYLERNTGKGIEGDPVRRVIELWTEQGGLICSSDLPPWDQETKICRAGLDRLGGEYAF